MKNTSRLFGIIALMVVIGLLTAVCKAPDSGSAPDIPTNVTATAASSSSIIISWNPVSGAEGYNVYRSSSYSGTFEFITSTSSTSYTDDGLSANTTYYYKVAAYNYYGWSKESGFVSAKTSGGGNNDNGGTNTYTVTFNANGGNGTAPSAQTVNAGSSITLPSGSGLSNSGYTFGGWNISPYGTGTNYSVGSSYMPTDNIILYAMWNATESVSPDRIEYYWVNQHGSLVTTSGGVTSIAAGETLAITAQGSGYVVQQWYLNGVNTGWSGNTYNFSSTTAGKHTVDLFVEKDGGLYNTSITITVVDFYTVTFDANSGSGTVSAQTANIGSSITLPSGSGLTMSGYTFGGWNTNSSGTGTNYSAGVSYTPTGDITLYAKWSLTPRTVTINMYDSYGDGWNGAALRININGTNLSSNATISSGSTNSYNFNAVSGDLVNIYWVSGSYNSECSFIVYYANTPPSPAFTTSNNNSWSGSNALIYKLRGSMNNISGGTLLGSFTVQ